MRKKLMALLLTLVMLLGLIPTMAFAASSELDTGLVDNKQDLRLRKYITPLEDDKYQVTLESYATGKSELKPLDIVLVLDVSGSMDDEVSTDTYMALDSTEYSYSSYGGNTYYYMDGEDYYQVEREWTVNDGLRYNLHYSKDGTTYYLSGTGVTTTKPTSISDRNTTIWTGVLYTKTISKINLMKNAVNDFIDAVAADPAAVGFAEGTAHKISIVKFASDEKETIGNDYTGKGYNCSQIVVGLTPVTGADDGEGITTLKKYVNALTASGATRVDYGMERAVAALNGTGTGTGIGVAEGFKANDHKAVIVVTDGVPTSNSNFEDAVANDAIGYAAQLKENGNTSVFMIGMLDNVSGDAEKFMNVASSNYPSSQKVTDQRYVSRWDQEQYTGTPLAKDAIYYYNDPNKLTLDGLFYRVRKFIATTATPADTEAVLHDQISEYFDYVPGSLAAYAVPCDATTGKWVELDNEYKLTIGSDINASMTDKVLTVDGYSFNKDHLHYQIPAMGSGQSAGDYIGEQLVVTYQIKRSDTQAASKKISVGGPTKIEKVLEPEQDPTELIGIKADALLATIGQLDVTYVLNGGTIPARSVPGQEPVSFTNPHLVPYGRLAAYVGGDVAGGWTITKSGKVFAGWYTDSELTRSWNFADPVTNDLTLYAKWVDAAYDITVKVSDGETLVDVDSVKLCNGENVFASNRRASSTGCYAFTDVPVGDYDVVATKGEVVATLKITVGADGEFTVTLPTDISTEVKKLDSEARDVSADLSELAKEYDPETGTAKIVMNVESVEDTERTTDRTKAEHAITAIKDAATAIGVPTANLEYMDVNLEHFVNDVSVGNITETAKNLSFTVQYPTAGKNIFVFRWHDATDDNIHDPAAGPIPMTKNPAANQEGYTVGNNSITIFSKNYSVYGIGWTEFTPPPAGGGIATYTVKCGTGVTSDKQSAASGATVTLTVAEGYVNPVVKDTDGKTVTVTASGSKFTFKMPASDVTVTVTSSLCPRDETCPIEAFTDTKNDFWWHDGIHYCLENSLMNGMTATTFEPNGNTTRAQVAVMIWRLAGSPVVDYAHPFTDVKDGYWYTEAIRWAAAENVVKGISETEFAPNAPVTREQLAAMLYRYAQYKGQGFTGAWAFLLDFADREAVSDWAYEAVCWCSMKSVVTGRTETEFVPGDNATRAEIAAMFQRFCENALAK